MSGRRRLFLLFVTLTGVAVVVGAAVWGMWPEDDVRVTVRNTNPSGKFLCLLADTPTGAEPLPWVMRHLYRSAELVYPARYGPDTRHAWGRNGIGDPKRLLARWRAADRYGELVWNGGDDWRVWWFDAAAVPIRNRSWVFARGVVDITLPPGDPGEPAPPELLDRTGFGPDIRESWKAFPDTFPPPHLDPDRRRELP